MSRRAGRTSICYAVMPFLVAHHKMSLLHFIKAVNGQQRETGNAMGTENLGYSPFFNAESYFHDRHPHYAYMMSSGEQRPYSIHHHRGNSQDLAQFGGTSPPYTGIRHHGGPQHYQRSLFHDEPEEEQANETLMGRSTTTATLATFQTFDSTETAPEEHETPSMALDRVKRDREDASEFHSDPASIPHDSSAGQMLLPSFSSSDSDQQTASKRARRPSHPASHFSSETYEYPSDPPDSHIMGYYYGGGGHSLWDDPWQFPSHGSTTAPAYPLFPLNARIGESPATAQQPLPLVPGGHYIPESSMYMEDKMEDITDGAGMQYHKIKDEEDSIQDDEKPHAVAAQDSISPEAKTTGGESTSEIRLHPSQEEIDSLPNPRAKDALEVWYERLRDLVVFKREYGHTNVKQKYTKNPSLGIWVNKQRCTRESLSDYKLAALEAIGFDWGKKKGDHAWNAKYEELKEYRKLHGDCQVPTKYPKNPSLGRWVSTQRSQYKAWKNHDKSTMNETKQKKLEKLGFVWSMSEH